MHTEVSVKESVELRANATTVVQLSLTYESAFPRKFKTAPMHFG